MRQTLLSTRDIFCRVELMATAVLKKIMSQLTIVMAAAMIPCSWMTPQAGPVFTYKKASGQTFADPEMTVSARSRIHCAIACRKYPHCTAFAFDDQRSSCLLRSAMSATSDPAKRLSLYTDESHCPYTALNISHGSVTLQRSLWSVEGNVTCDNDYFLLQNVTPAVTCLANGRWTSINAECAKRVWRYPETKNFYGVHFPIPGTVVTGWSLCVEGVPTNNTVIPINVYSGPNVYLHVKWMLNGGYLGINDWKNAAWGSEIGVRNPPFPLTVGNPFFYRMTVTNSTSVGIYMNNMFFYTFTPRFLPSTFSDITIGGDVNLTKVEAWCKG